MYKHPISGQTWTGKGKTPAWVEASLAENPNATMDSLTVDHKSYGAFIPVPENAPVTLFDALDKGNLKAAMANAGAGSGEMWNVPFGELKFAPGFNVRNVQKPDYVTRRDWLKAQIAEFGYDRTKPMTGYIVKEDGKDVVYVTNGHTRSDAIRTGIADGTIPFDVVVQVVTPNKGTTVEDLSAGLITENMNSELAPDEKAVVFKRFLGYGWDEAKIAHRFSYTVPYVKQILSILDMPAQIRNSIASGKVSASEAAKVVKKHGGQGAVKVLAAAQQAAAAAGKSKVTAKHVKASGTPTVSPIVAKAEQLQHALSERDAQIGHVSRLFNDEIKPVLIDVVLYLRDVGMAGDGSAALVDRIIATLPTGTFDPVTGSLVVPDKADDDTPSLEDAVSEDTLSAEPATQDVAPESSLVETSEVPTGDPDDF